MKWFLTFVLFSACGFAHAEGGCPAGMIPYSGADLSSCGPFPAGYYGDSRNDDSQTFVPAARWENRWGAVAMSDVNSAVGVSSDMLDEQAARQAALADCRTAGGQAGCEVRMSYHNQCIVIAWGEKSVNTSRAETIDQASRSAMQGCSGKSEGCRIVYSKCSLPQRIQ